MGESPRLVRSFSSPTDTSCVAQEFQGNPMPVLGESISFGRFMSESLAWEKWSAFSQNRYVEEAEKFSKPGSVAEKKAYFEAHYKRKAAERAAALIQEANALANGTPDSETQEGNCTDSSIEIKSKVESNITANRQPDAVNFQVVGCANSTKYKCGVEQNDLDISKVEEAEDLPDICVVTNHNVAKSILVDNSSQFDNVEVHENIATPIEGKMHDPGTASQEVWALPVKEREVQSSSKLSTKDRAAKISCSPDERRAAAAVQSSSGISSGLKGKKSVGDLFEKNRLTARSLHMSINLPSGTRQTSKTAVAAVQPNNKTNSGSKGKKSVNNGDAFEKKRPIARSLHTSISLSSGPVETSKTAAASIQPRNGINSASKGKKHVSNGDTVEKKRLTARSLHMSISLSSGPGETSKTAAASIQSRNVINSASKSLKSVGYSVENRPTVRSLHMSVNLPSAPSEKCKTASLFEHNRIKKINSILPNISKDHQVASWTSTKASNGLFNKTSANVESQGRSCLKSSSTSKSNPQTSTLSSPFRFRSEERAGKHREFLQIMDETKCKEAEKVQLQRKFKEKSQHDPKKLWKSCGSKPKLLNEDCNGRLQSPSYQMRKGQMSLIQPVSPKPGRKTSSSTVKNLGNSWKPPTNTNNTKRASEKTNRMTRRSVASLPNISRENASPNIQ